LEDNWGGLSPLRRPPVRYYKVPGLYFGNTARCSNNLTDPLMPKEMGKKFVLPFCSVNFVEL
jgi:hypothetical protein